MPELPEVETVKNGLNKIVKGLTVLDVKVNKRQLRYKVPHNFKKTMVQAGKIKRVVRRAKYLIFELESSNMLNHLGMTGNWKLKPSSYKPEKHDHLEFTLSNNKVLIYNDPRRFGWVEIIKDQNSYFKNKNHGPEPLSESFSQNYLSKVLENKKAAIKSVIMDQKVVLGVGNIYACECLYMSGVSPLKPAGELTKSEIKKIIVNIKKVLRAAIKAGGSTVKDFKKAGGEAGYFQTQLKVYAREGSPCQRCGCEIINVKIGGRSSFYCDQCQS